MSRWTRISSWRAATSAGAIVGALIAAGMQPAELQEVMRTVDYGRFEDEGVDGGMLSNFPIDVLDRSDGKTPRWPTFGIKLSARPSAPTAEKFRVKGTFGLAEAMVGTMTNFHDQMHIDDPAVLARTMFVDTGSVKATDFDIDRVAQDMLFTHGEDAATRFLATWDFAGYVQQFRSGGDP